MVRTGLAALALGALLAVGLAHASGTGTPGETAWRDNEITRTDGAQQLTPAQQATAARRAYARGQSLYRRRLVCRDCPFPDGIEDQEIALDVVLRVNDGEFGLDAPEDRDAVIYYMAERFRLQPEAP